MSLKLNESQGLSVKLRKAGQLSASDWLLLMRAMGWFVVVELGLRLFALKTLLAILERGGRSGEMRTGRGSASPDRAAYCVELASRLDPFDATCLKKALVLYALLKRKGVDVRLVIGATKAGRKLDAHAWLEHQGRVIIGESSDPYAPLCTLAGS